MDALTVSLFLVVWLAVMVFHVGPRLIRKFRQDRGMKHLFGREHPWGAGAVDGVEYKYTYDRGGRRRASSFVVEVDAPSDGDFKITREKGLDRWAKSIGLTVELETGDPRFDREFFLDTESLAFTRYAFREAGNRDRARAIMRTGFTRVEHDGKSLKAVLTPAWNMEVDEGLVETVAGRLADLARGLPGRLGAVRGSLRDAYSPSWKGNRTLAFALIGVPLAAGFASLFFGIELYKPLDFGSLILPSIKVGLPLIFFLLVVDFLLVKGRSSSHREFLVILVMALMALPAASLGLTTLLNGYLDHSAAVPHTGVVVRKSLDRDDDGTTYYAHVESWNAPGFTEAIVVTRGQYERITPRSTEMTVTTHEGRFGYEWIEGYTIR